MCADFFSIVLPYSFGCVYPETLNFGWTTNLLKKDQKCAFYFALFVKGAGNDSLH